MTLHDQLHELTDDVGHAPPPPDLWDRGRRWQRSRRLGTAAVLAVACVLAVALGSFTWVRATPAPTPASYDGQPALPDRVFEPSRWLPEGHLHAPLVAIRHTPELGAWWGSRAGVVGISATTGEYRVLPLPEHAYGSGSASLSPDGTRVAYWTRGEPTGDPNTSGGQTDTVTGVAVYNAVTGEVRRAPIPTRHGLMVGEPPVWADSDSLVLSFNQYMAGDHGSDMKRHSGAYAAALVWSMADAVPRSVDALGRSPVILAAGNGNVLVSEDRGARLVDVRTGRGQGLGLVGPMGTTGVALSSVALSTGGQVAMAGGGALPTKSPNKVTVARVPRSGSEVRQRVVPGSGRTFQVVGWSDERTLVVVGRAGRGFERLAVDALDVRTGERERLVRMRLQSGGLSWEWADDHLDAPVVPGREPAAPLDPRVVWVGSGLLVIGTFVALRRWRSRVRP